MPRMHAIVVAALAAGSAFGQVTTIDFSTEDDGITPLVNGQQIDDEFGFIFNLSSFGGSNSGIAVFDTGLPSPNQGGGDGDLLVGLGNALILQNNGGSFQTQTTPGVFDTPNDDPSGGTIRFDFTLEVELLEITLIDIDNSAATLVTLTDSSGNTRVYDVPDNWTFDVDNTPDGFDVLDLTTLASQQGEAGGIATASQDAGFDATRVVRLDVALSGSGAIDNLVINGTDIPAPGGAAALGLGGLLATRRRRG
ncbi:MAG: hypothetical protein AAFR38_09960 [Planctomycetota bacterium]